ncbi:hypothetical protein LPB86_07550 [Pedobacter sp. MC2016-14]|uniref:hypothetical protein n=1 Tax=Pedobacter sp. MC2016-14 TaxID=2897327 RepID=UPI001E2888C7|nr:hypothetical protein [Pedobacter sp. MC2016-14]MCD0488079.1 hypothetical protein [Pedobacter sp. MC2016-14]
MISRKSVPVKVMLLLIVFLLNTVVGFACAIGIDMGFNSAHLEQESEGHGHHHSQTERYAHNSHQHVQHPKQDANKDNCCKDEAAKLTKSDKLNNPVVDLSQISLPFMLLVGNVYPQIAELRLPSNVSNAYFSRHCRSPIRDVRIAIQSFQI